MRKLDSECIIHAKDNTYLKLMKIAIGAEDETPIIKELKPFKEEKGTLI